MADNLTTQSSTLATIPASSVISTDEVAVNGGTTAHVQHMKLVDGAANGTTGIASGGGVEAAALRVTLASDSTGVVSVDDNGSTLSVDDGGGALTVDGTVAVSGTVTVDSELPAAAALADNTANPTVPAVGTFGHVWDGVTWDRAPGTAADGALVNLGANNDVTVTAISAGDNNIGNVDIASVPAPLSTTGGGVEATALRVTVASDSTGVLSVDDNGGALTVDNGGTFAVQESGAALTALQLIDNLVLAEDAAHGSGDAGVQMLAVRKDAAAAIAGTDGDYTPLQTDNAGSLRVVITGGAGAGGTSATDESAYTPTTSAGTPIMGAADETTPDSAAEGTLAIIRSTLSRALHVNLRDASGNEVSVGGGTQYDEDAAHTTGSKVTGAGIVRKDTAASLAGTDGDYTLPIADASGRLWTHDPVAEALLTTIDGDTGTLAGAVAGTEMQVDVVAALPAGTNNIGDVDVLSIVPGTGATNLGKAEDAAHTTGDVGVAAMSVRQDTAAALSGTDGDYQPLITDASGRLHVNVGNTVTVGSHAVTNAGTFAVQVDAAIPAGTNNIGDVDIASIAAGDNNIGNVDVLSVVPGTGATALGKAEDGAHSTGDTGVYALAVRDDTLAAHSGTDGDYESIHTTAEGAVWTSATGNTTGGHTIFRSIDLDETEEEVKASAGTVYAILFTNTATATRWLKVYNATAANVTVGTTTPVITFGLPGNASDDVSGAVPIPEGGIKFDTAITVAATTGVADNDTGAPAANDVIVNVLYR